LEWATLFTGLAAWLPSLFLHLVRVAAFFVAQPMFGVTRDSMMLRIVLTLTLGLLFFGANGHPVVPASGLTEFALLAAREAVIGFGFGFAVRLLTTAMAIAGEIISHEMGFGMARIVDPSTGRSSPVISQLFQTVALLLIFELDIHHHVLLSFASIYEFLPVGQGFSIEPVFERMTAMVGATIVFAVRYAIPVIGVMVLLSAVLVMLARAVPNINLLEFAFPVRILLALTASLYFLTSGTPFLEAMFESLLEQARLLFTEV